MFREKKMAQIKNMTEGKILPLLLKFSLPLLAGNLFQQMYNTVDSIVVGNYVGKEALAAIGSTGMLINMIIGFFMGFSTGGGIIISQFFGGKKIIEMRKTIHTMILGTIILGIFLTVFGILANPTLLKWMSTPSDVFEDAKTYLHIYFEGLIFLMIYNMGSGVLRALGNSRLPFIFLVISSILNIALDLLFVVVFDFGIRGAAYATIISEAVSAFLVLLSLFCTKEVYKISLKELKITFPILKKIISIGFPGAFQMSLTCFSNVFVQGYINSFGSDCMAGWASFSKIDSVCLLPMQSMSLGATTFVGQNYGAGNIKRAKQGIMYSALISMIISAIVMIPVKIFDSELVGLFNTDEGVIYYGTYLVKMCSFFYIIRCVNQIFAGGLRGFGNAKAPMIILLTSFVAFRQLYLFITTRLTDSFFPVSIAYPVGWTVCSVTMFLYYLHYVKKMERKQEFLGSSRKIIEETEVLRHNP